MSRVTVTALAGLSLALGLAAGPQPEDATATSATPATPAPAVFMGAEVCQQCHFDRFESYQNSPHALAGDPRTPAAKQACETCHGAGGQHVDGGGGRGVGGVKPFNATMTAEAKNAVCLECHARGIVALWPGSMHESRDLACTDCHSIHSGHTKLLAEASQPPVCVRCHQQIRAQLMRPSHHPIREQKLVCTDCHNPHGTVSERLISATTINDKCYECHAEKRGPFLWEHPPVRESCLNCHEPHGSTHEPLLRVKRPLLCQRCHNTVGHPSVLWARTQDEEAAGLSPYELRRQGLPATMLFQRSCTNCHVNLHGSNHPSGKLFHR
ncbi:MAG TPA: DmsE family decaheme c-type cytochrome [Thermoanaerobaculia bacterium]|jgi:DmsE family decaheme c-type cytochrome